MALKLDKSYTLGERKPLYQQGLVPATTNRPAVHGKGDALEWKMTRYKEKVDIVIPPMVK